MLSYAMLCYLIFNEIRGSACNNINKGVVKEMMNNPKKLKLLKIGVKDEVAKKANNTTKNENDADNCCDSCPP
jgi:hypothetical protein